MLCINTDLLIPGAEIQYRLLPRDHPTVPGRLWRGKVKYVTRSKANKDIGMCLVESLEAGYEEDTEWAIFDQIVSVVPS